MDCNTAGRKELSDARKLELIQATAKAAALSGHHVELIYATGKEVRAQLILQVRKNAIAAAKERARVAGVEYKAPSILKKDIEPHLPPTPETVTFHQFGVPPTFFRPIVTCLK